MELRDYLAAVRRFWMTWVGLTLVAVVAALVVVNLLPRTYQATARVFVTSSAESGSASAFLVQRVKSYPDVAVSHAVLGPVVDELGLSTSVQELRRAISATNPPDTSQVHITVQSASASEAADIANAVAMQFTTVVEDLEQPREGNSPVQLTVTDPATAPSAPVSPVPWLILTVGAVLGLGLGLAVAVVRSRLDTAVYNEDDVRRSWGDDAEGLTVHATPPGRGRRSLLTGRPAALLARRLELLAEERPARLVVLSPSPVPSRAPRPFAEEVAGELQARGVPTGMGGGPVSRTEGSRPAAGATADRRAQVRLDLVSPVLPLRDWRRIAREYDGVVLVVEVGRVDRSELRETRSVLEAAGIDPLAVVLTRRGRLRRGATGNTFDLSRGDSTTARRRDDATRSATRASQAAAAPASPVHEPAPATR